MLAKSIPKDDWLSVPVSVQCNGMTHLSILVIAVNCMMLKCLILII